MTDQIETLREAAETKYARIRNNQDLSGEAKRRLIAQAYIELTEELDKIKADDKSSTSGRRDTLARKLYGIPNAGDSSAMISYRDAQDRATKLEKASDAIDLMARAQTSGDDLLVRAILEQGYDNKWSEVINSYIAKNPTRENDAEELWDLVASAGSNNFLIHLTHLAVTPPELTTMSDWKIAEIATGTAATTQVFA